MWRKSLVVFAVAAVTFGVGLGLWQTQPTRAQAPAAFSLPPQAAEVAPGVFFLGAAVDNGRTVEGYAFLHTRGRTLPDHKGKPHGKPDKPGNGGGGSSCFAFLANGANWKTVEN